MMYKFINYPVKYAVMPIMQKKDAEEYGACAYIVSKVYLLSEKTRYYENGLKDSLYEVVYPYRTYLDIRNGRNIPKFDKSDKCTNSEIVTEVYDDYISAIKDAQIKNYILEGDLYYLIPSDDEDCLEKRTKIIREFEEMIKIYRKFEETLMEATADMVINKDDIYLDNEVKL